MAYTLRQLIPESLTPGRLERAALVKRLAETEGVTVRTIQRRLTETGTQKRGQTEKGLSRQGTQAVAKYFKENPVKSEEGAGIGHRENAEDRILQQQVFSSRESADSRVQEWERDGEGYDQMGSAPLSARARQIEMYYAPAGSTYRNWNSKSRAWENLTAPPGGVYLAQLKGN